MAINKKAKKYFLLSILPVYFICFTILLRNTEGPYYNGDADPSYVYLINSANLAQMNSLGLGHVDHPGTPLHILGAFVIKAIFLINNDKDSIAEDVIYHPDHI
ncbi:MAG: hypothetical protein ABI462_10660 [Ignavibacteria bacterium]